MTPERYQKICDIFVDLQEIPLSERDAFLAKVCGDDTNLRNEVEKLLRSDKNSGDFIETPAMQVVAEILAKETGCAKIGLQIGQYQIVSLLGAGGMGEVWLAEDTKLKRRIALKLLSNFQNKDRLSRFEREAFAVSALNHPNIITIFDIGESDGQQFIATEFVEGKTLRQLVNEKKLDLLQVIDLALQVCAAISAAHLAGIIHRDIKPENIMVRADKIVKVLDFGLAKLTDPENNVNGLKQKQNSELKQPKISTPGLVMGTVNYMSPEQACGLPVDEKTDVFSFGILFYEMLTQTVPFTGVNEVETLAAILDRDPQPLSPILPKRLIELVNKCLSKNTLERPNASQILEELLLIKRDLEFRDRLNQQTTAENFDQEITSEINALTEETIPKTKPSFFSPKKTFLRPQIIALLAFILIGGLTILAYFQFNKKNPAAIFKESEKILLADFENKTGDGEFDKILRQPLAVSLSQSPYLTIVTDGQIQQILKEMQKQSGEPLTFEISREICQRRGIKAFLKGTIENLGIEYLLTLEAFNAETGESLLREQISSKDKESIISSLGEISTQIREKLGESVSSVKRLNTPLRESTTNSLEALKSYTIASNNLAGGKNDAAIPLFKRSIELDPNFVAAYASLANALYNSGQRDLAAGVMEKAYSLRERATEREKLKITNFYHAIVTGDMEKNIEAMEIYRQLYPNDQIAPHNLSEANIRLGRFEKAVEFSRIAISLDPNIAVPYFNLGKGLTLAGHFDEAKTIWLDALEHKFQSLKINKGLFTIALAQGDQEGMRQQLEIIKAKEPDSALSLEGNFLISEGRWREYRKVIDQAIIEGEKEGNDIAADYASQFALNSAAVGMCREALNYQNKALKFDRGQDFLQDSALTFALCGGPANQITTELKERFPNNTVVNKIWLPVVNAALSLNNSPEKTLEILEATRPFEGGSYFWDNFLRGKAYLKLNKNEMAISEFQKIIQHRGWSIHSPLFALAYFEISKAYEQQKDTENSKQFAEKFALIWKNADKDLPTLRGYSNALE